MATPLKTYDFQVIALLRLSPFERRRRGWQFGLKRVPDETVERLVAAGRARIDGDKVRLVEREARP